MSDEHRFGDYVAVEQLGQGGQGSAWRAYHHSSPDEIVLLKAFGLANVEEWKSVELFERSARMLETLDHPFIPAYRDHFELSDDSGIRLCLVREFVPGKSLQDHLDQSGSLGEDEVLRLTQQLLDVLEYLHGLDPPVVHRDIKPANVIVTPDGSPRLVDFGTVQADVVRPTGGSTVVGTAGYVAPEQLMGRAQPASDIYSLGVTLGHVLTGVSPTELPTDGFELDFDDVLETSNGLGSVVSRMTRADIDERLASIDELRELFGLLSSGQTVAVEHDPFEPPKGSQLEVVKDANDLIIRTPPALVWSSQGSLKSSLQLASSQRLVHIALFVIALVVVNLSFLVFGAWVQFLFVLSPLLIVGFFAARTERKSVLVTLRKHALEVRVPVLMEPPGGQNALPMKAVTQVGRVVVEWEDLESVEIVRAGAKRYALELDTVEAQVGGNQLRVSGRLRVELGLTQGEYIWLVRLLNERWNEQI